MGTWGTGNFDSDGAGDYVDSVVDQLARTIEEILADENRSKWDEDGEGMLMPSVDLIYLICTHTRSFPPEETIIKEWRETYLSQYQYKGDEENESAFAIERRKVIEDTFEKLQILARDCDKYRGP